MMVDEWCHEKRKWDVAGEEGDLFGRRVHSMSVLRRALGLTVRVMISGLG